MKRIKEIIGVLLLVTGIACTEDKGNYNYTPLNELTINGINKTYVAEIAVSYTHLTLPTTERV